MMGNMAKNIVVLGGGYAGVLTAKKLEKRLKKRDDVNIVLIDKNPFHTMLTELHEVAAGRVEDEAIKIDLKKIFAKRKVNVVLDNIEKIDFEKKVLVGKESYNYDCLVIATGSRPTFFGVEGAEENAFKLWSYDDAVKLHAHIRDCFLKASRCTDEEEKKKLLTFFVVGAGFTGVEMIGELAEYVPILCGEFSIDRNDVNLYCVDILKRTVPNLPEKLSGKIERRLKKMGVNLLLETGVVKIGKDDVHLQNNGSSKAIVTKTVIWAAGIEGAKITKTFESSLQMAGRGRIKCDKYLRAEGMEDVFVAGDNIFYIPEGEEAPVPQMVENAEQSSALVAKNVISYLFGNKEYLEYKPKFHGVMVCVGGRYGVAHVGTPKRMFMMPSFIAMFIKHFINMVYFAQVCGWNKIFKYLNHEFFHVKHNRSFVGGHFSAKTANFWLVPLRVYLGVYWLIEGIKKVQEGWLKKPMLEAFFGGADAFFNGIINGVSAGASATAEVAGASQAVAESAGSVIFNWNIFNIFNPVLVDSGTDYAFRMSFSLMDWFKNTVILSSGGVQLFFQIVIVISEILIGLSLIGGLFTFLSSAYSLVLQVMFIMTTGLYMGTWWMIFAGIAVLFGSGSVLGLDYYVLPALKKWWKNVGFARKWYLYHD